MTASNYGSGGYGGTPEDPPVPLTAEDIVTGAIAVGHALIDNMPTVGDTLLKLRGDLLDAKAKARQFAEDLVKETKAHQATAAERDTAVVRAEEAEEIAGETRSMLRAAHEANDTLRIQLDEKQAALTDLEQQRADDRLTIADLEQRLTDCQAGQVEP